MRAACVRLPPHRASVCSTSSRSIASTVEPISIGTIWLGARECESGGDNSGAGARHSWDIYTSRSTLAPKRGAEASGINGPQPTARWAEMVNEILTAKKPANPRLFLTAKRIARLVFSLACAPTYCLGGYHEVEDRRRRHARACL